MFRTGRLAEENVKFRCGLNTSRSNRQQAIFFRSIIKTFFFLFAVVPSMRCTYIPFFCSLKNDLDADWYYICLCLLGKRMKLLFFFSTQGSLQGSEVGGKKKTLHF